MQSSKILTSVLLYGFVVSANALTLRETYDLAIQADPKVKNAQAMLDANQEELSKAKAGYLPKINLSMSHGRGATDIDTGNVLSSGNRNYDTKNYALTLKQPLLNFALSKDVGKANSIIEMGNADLQGVTNSLVTRLAQRYFDVLLSEEVMNNERQKLESLESQKKQINGRLVAGVSAKNEASDIDAEIFLSKARLSYAEVHRNVVKKNLEAMVGQTIDILSRIDPKQNVDKQYVERTLIDWIALAQKNNPEIKKAHHEITMSEFEYEKNKASHYPTLDFVVTRSRSESDTNNTIGSKFDTTTGILQLNLPIYSGGYMNAMVKQSAAMMVAKKSAEEMTGLELLEKVTQGYGSFHSASQLKAAYENAIQSYQSSLDGTKKAFEAGTKTFADVVIAQDKVNETTLNYHKASYEYLLNFYMLKELTGEISADDLNSNDMLMLRKK